MSDEGGEEELVLRAVAGDRGAIVKLLGRSRQALCKYVRLKVPTALRGVVDAEDIVQDTHIEVFRNIETFEPREAGSLERWVRTIAVRKLRDAVRKQRAAKRGGGAAPAREVPEAVGDSMVALLDLVAGPDKTASSVLARAEAVGMMQVAMSQLPEDFRRVLWLTHIEERPVAEVAAEMGRSAGAIRVLSHKARKRLAQILGSRSRFLSNSG